ncbi:Replication factor C subunit 1 [Gryllus bimaculatus]|nr:Replication factor C subunit 1 [Gryllus bimaculatus]
MKDLTHYFQSPNKIVNANNSSVDDVAVIEKSPPDLGSDRNGSVSPCFERLSRNGINEAGSLENHVCDPEECQVLVKEHSSARKNKRKCLTASGKPSGYVNGTSNCDEGESSKQLEEKTRKGSKKKYAENGNVISDEKCVEPESPEGTSLSPNAFQVLMSTQQVFSSTNSGRKNCSQDIVENDQLKRENKKKIQENLEQMAKRKLEMEANIKACEIIGGKSAKKRRRIIVESDPESEATSVTENSSDAMSDQVLENKPGKRRKSVLKVDIKRKQSKNKISDEISELEILESEVVKSRKFNKKKNEESNARKSKNMEVNVCNEIEVLQQNNIDLQNSTADTKVEDLEVKSNVDNEKCGNSDPSAMIINSNDFSATPNATMKKGNILNYFNKVSNDVKRQQSEKIKVTADVHFPVVSDVKVSRKVVMKKRSKKKESNEDDIQLIDSEIIEKQNLEDSETTKSFAAVVESRVPCATSPPLQTESKCSSPSLKNWKIRIQIKQSPTANRKEKSSPVKKRKLKIHDKKPRNSETSLNITLEKTDEVPLSNNNRKLDGKDIPIVEDKLQNLRESSPSSSLQKKKKLVLAKSTPVKNKSCKDKEGVCELKETADENEPLLRRMKEVLDNEYKKSKNSRLDKEVTLNEKRSTGVKVHTPKGRKTFVAKKSSTPTLESKSTEKKGSFLKNCNEGNQLSPEPTGTKTTLKRKRSFVLQESPPLKKSGAKSSPIKKTIKNKSPAKDNLAKKDTSTPKKVLEEVESLLENEESLECTFIKKNGNCLEEESISSKKNIGNDSFTRGKKVLSLTKHKNNMSSEEKDETSTCGRAKRSCTTKKTTYIEEDIDTSKKSKGEAITARRKRSVSARTPVHEESNAFQSSNMFESLSSSAGRRSSSRKKSAFLAADYGISDDEEEDFDDDSDDDFFGDSDYYDSDFGDSDENFINSDHQECVDSTFDLKEKNDKEGNMTSKRRHASLRQKKALSKSIPISKKELIAAFSEKVAISKVKRAQSKGKMLNQEVVLQFIKKAKGTLNRKMALHDPENFPCKQTNDAGKKSVPIKLAPVFVSQKAKKPDKVTMLARKTFLQSGVPEVVKKMVEVQKLAEEQEHTEFPLISHIQQKDDGALVWNLADALQKFPPTLDVTLPTPSEDFKGNFTKCTEGSISTMTYSASQPPKILLFRDFLRCIKAESRDFPVYRTFRYLLEINHPQQLKGVKDNAEKKGKRRSSLAKKKEQANSAQDSEKRCAAWTAKYRPLSSENILGNGYTISRFKKWLELWVQVKENTFQKKFKEDVSSGDEFLNDASDDESGRTVLPKKSVVLMGPTGSGKTMTVYALAHELGFKVLEVNAASKRTGRRILSELLEATQSHQVQGKGDETVSGIKSFFTTNGPSQKTKQPKKETEQISKLSLILVDDVDVVFEEEDEGFVSALSTLVIGSKRPVVLVTSDSSCPHLPRFMENSLVLEFRHPPSKMISKCWLTGWLFRFCERYGKIWKTVGEATNTDVKAAQEWKDHLKNTSASPELEACEDHCEVWDQIAKELELPSSVFDDYITIDAGTETSVWLQLVALLEGVRVRKSCVEELLRFNKGDVRKTLLQLQFWVLSGGENSKALPESSNETPEDFPDDTSNSSWVSLDDKKIKNDAHHPLHSQCLSSFLELDDLILQVDWSKIWWNMPQLAGLNQVSHVKTSEMCNNEGKKEITHVAPSVEASLERESRIKGDNEEHNKWKSVCSVDHMRVLVQLADALSVAEELSSATDSVASEPYQCAWEKAPFDSLSLSQDMRPSAYGTKVTAQSIGNWLVSASVSQSSSLLCPEKHLPLANVIQQQPPQEEMSWREQQHNACREFEDAISMLYWPQRRAVSLDYMSCLRTISRLENDRVSVNDKRNNRFFHYLRGLGAHPSPSALDTACNVFNFYNNL